MTPDEDDVPVVLPGQGGLDFDGGPPVFPCNVDAFTDDTGALWGWECSGCGRRVPPMFKSMPDAITDGTIHIQGPR